MPRGRKTKLNSVLEHIEQIKQWKKIGATDEQICDQLNLSRSTWYEYLKTCKELSDAVKMGATGFILELKGDLAKQAMKHTLETKKQYVKVDLETGHKTQYTEITTKEVDGNVGAAHLLLKNIDHEHWKENWDSYEFKKQELEIKKQLADANLF